MSAVVENKPRQQISQIVGLKMSVARTRRWIDSQGLNHVVQKEIDECNETLQNIEKDGGPSKPRTAPKQPKDDATDDEMTAYTAVRAVWDKEHAQWKDYKSAKFRKLEVIHDCHKVLSKLLDRLTKKSPSDRVVGEITALKTQLSDKAMPKQEDETPAVFKQRVKAFKPVGFAKLCGTTDLNDPAAVEAQMTKLTERFSDLETFLRKDSLSKQKVRFNEEGSIAIATIEENLVRELAINAIRNATSQSKKIIKPDHIIATNAYQDSPYFQLFDILPRFSALVERQNRRDAHTAETKTKKNDMYKEARQRCTRAKINYTQEHRPDFDTLPTFEDAEVEGGFAKKENVERTSKGKTTVRSVYLWKGIDYDDDDDDDNVNFEFYAGDLCKAIKDTENIQSSDGDFADGIKVSKDIKKFLSNTVIDWLTRFAPKLRLLIQYNGVKTVDGSTVLTALKIMLSESYINRDGQIPWQAEHQALFSDIERRLELWNNHSSSNSVKAEDDSEDR